MIDMSIYTRNLPVGNSGHYIQITGLRNFFFVLQDLIDRILIFREQLFGGTCFLLTSNPLRYKFFSNENKQPSLKWRCINLQGEIMAESRR